MFEHSGKAKLREAIVSGIFYPEEPAELDELISELLAQNRPPREGATAIVAPHAGLRYSGDLAALAWNAALGRQVSAVVVLSPMHRPSDAFVYLPESDFFDGPFGPVPVDKAIVEEMMDCGTLFRTNDIPHFEEHGVEMQLPFMRRLFPDASLVPVILGAPTAAAVKALSAALDLVIGERIEDSLIVVSSDLAGGGAADAAAQADRFLDCVEARDWRGMLAPGDVVPPAACGAGCLAAFLSSTLADGKKGQLLGRHDSEAFRESADERLVHYAAIAYYND